MSFAAVIGDLLLVTWRKPAHQKVSASISASVRISSSLAWTAARLNTPRCGPGRYR